MRKKIASITYFELGDKIDKEIQNLENGEKKKGKIMVASQLYFYAGETGLKYLFGLGNYSLGRNEILLELKTYNKLKLTQTQIKKIEELYLDLLPKNIGGNGLRNLGAYKGKNSTIYLAHKEFAIYINNILKNENNN